jgi:hypothetical protein
MWLERITDYSRCWIDPIRHAVRIARDAGRHDAADVALRANRLVIRITDALPANQRNAVTYAAALRAVAVAQARAGATQDATDTFRAASRALDHGGDASVEWLQAQLDLGGHLGRSGRHGEACAVYDAALRGLAAGSSAVNPEHPIRSTLMRARGVSLFRDGALSDAAKAFAQSEAWINEDPDEVRDWRGAWLSLRALESTLRAMGNDADANDARVRAAAALAKAPALDPLDDDDALHLDPSE